MAEFGCGLCGDEMEKPNERTLVAGIPGTDETRSCDITVCDYCASLIDEDNELISKPADPEKPFTSMMNPYASRSGTLSWRPNNWLCMWHVAWSCFIIALFYWQPTIWCRRCKWRHFRPQARVK